MSDRGYSKRDRDLAWTLARFYALRDSEFGCAHTPIEILTGLVDEPDRTECRKDFLRDLRELMEE